MSIMHMHTMVDLETWATTDNSVIRAAAVVNFTADEITWRGLIDARHSVDDQILHGRAVDTDTVSWWQKQAINTDIWLNDPMGDAVGRLDYTVGVLSELQLMSEIVDLLHGEHKIWSRGTFDLDIIRHLITSNGEEVPWQHWQERDVRTLDSFTPKPKPEIPHDPLSDALAQVQQAQTLMRLTSHYGSRSAA